MLGRESGAGRKKLGQFSFSSEERIGKGYSSVVYRGCNDHTSTHASTQTRPSPSRQSI